MFFVLFELIVLLSTFRIWKDGIPGWLFFDKVYFNIVVDFFGVVSMFKYRRQREFSYGSSLVEDQSQQVQTRETEISSFGVAT